jgi:hypothetical protein
MTKKENTKPRNLRNLKKTLDRIKRNVELLLKYKKN